VIATERANSCFLYLSTSNANLLMFIILIIHILRRSRGLRLSYSNYTRRNFTQQQSLFALGVTPCEHGVSRSSLCDNKRTFYPAAPRGDVQHTEWDNSRRERDDQKSACQQSIFARKPPRKRRAKT
jgi:hypothetical protein